MGTIALCQKWPDREPNLCPDDIVLIVDERSSRGRWRLGRVVKTFPDAAGMVRSAEVKTEAGILHRPVTKLCLISESDSDKPNRHTISLRNRTSTPSGGENGATGNNK